MFYKQGAASGASPEAEYPEYNEGVLAREWDAVERVPTSRYAFKPLRSGVNLSLARIISCQVTTPFL